MEIEHGNRKFKNVILTFLAICLTWWFPFHQVITASGLEPELVHSISYVLNADKWALLFVIFTSNGFTGIRRVSLNRYQSKKSNASDTKAIQFRFLFYVKIYSLLNSSEMRNINNNKTTHDFETYTLWKQDNFRIFRHFFEKLFIKFENMICRYLRADIKIHAIFTSSQSFHSSLLTNNF